MSTFAIMQSVVDHREKSLHLAIIERLVNVGRILPGEKLAQFPQTPFDPGDVVFTFPNYAGY